MGPETDNAEDRLRRDALSAFSAAVEAVEPERLVAEFLDGRPEVIRAAGRVRVAAVGKAAAAMARGVARARPGLELAGVVIAPEVDGAALPAGLDAFAGGHPVPNEAGVAGAERMAEMAAGLDADDLLLCLVSGGGSALATLPAEGVGLEELRLLTTDLLAAGAEIGELNAVRKHLDRLKGGGLARLAAPARVVALVLSDVVGDPLDVIASGPVSPDPTTFAEAISVLERRGVWERAPAGVRRRLEAGQRGEIAENPKTGDPCFARVEVRVIGHNRMAAEAALARAAERGYRPLLLTTRLVGEAREAGAVLAAIAREVATSGRPVSAPACLVAAGETTVKVTGGGRGGRNQEVALGAALVLEGAGGVVLLAAGTDGVDGPTDAAGAVADGRTAARARALGLEPRAALADNDAYPFFEALGDLVLTGPTGTNVMDLTIAMVAAPRGAGGAEPGASPPAAGVR